MEILAVQCAWCGRCRCGDHWVQLRGAHVKPAVTSHGLCPRCFDALTRQPSIRGLLESAPDVDADETADATTRGVLLPSANRSGLEG
jgi:hypothetical protein